MPNKVKHFDKSVSITSPAMYVDIKKIKKILDTCSQYMWIYDEIFLSQIHLIDISWIYYQLFTTKLPVIDITCL